jgi:SAM-dependent methyltransferase
LAERFPRSRFTGLDFSADTIAAANEEARLRGLTNATFRAVDAAKWDEAAAYDYVFTFDAIHDQARPDLVLANIRRALRPGGAYLMQDIRASSDVAEDCANPLAPFTYTISCMHCMSVSLASGGMGLGAAWGRRVAQRMLGEAGFTSVAIHELPHDILNDYYVCRA